MRLIILLFISTLSQAQYCCQFAVIKYNGGGDWYANPTSLPNLAAFCNSELNMNINPKTAVVELGSTEIFSYPFLHLTGHGNVVLSEEEKQNLTSYLLGGGFLHVDDNYGLDVYIRPLLNQLLPGVQLEELGSNHPIFSIVYSFHGGLPKIHEHDNKPPQAFALFYEGRMVLLYTYETDLGDGWEDANVHNNSEETRLKALKMGANIVTFVFTGQ